MDMEKTGCLIAQLRREQNLTQKKLADLLHLSDRTISKWERGAGSPDVSLWEKLSDILGVSVCDLLAGERTLNPKDGGNMKQTQFYVCPHCGNILTASARAQLTCCGTSLTALQAIPEDETHSVNIEVIDGEYYISAKHPMSKEHYISFMALLSGDKLYINRLYPEGDAAVRFPRIGMGTLYYYCTEHGMFRKYIRRERKV